MFDPRIANDPRWLIFKDKKGQVHKGFVHGRGGLLGSGCMHTMDAAFIHKAATDSLERAILLVNKYGKEDPGIASNKPYCCILYPEGYETVDGPILKFDVDLRGAVILENTAWKNWRYS